MPKLKQFTASNGNNSITSNDETVNSTGVIFKFIMYDIDGQEKCLVADANDTSKTLYDEQLLSRVYAIKNQQDTCSTPTEKLMSITQYANYEFSLTEYTSTPPTYKTSASTTVSDQHKIGLYGISEASEKTNLVSAGPTTVVDKMHMLMDVPTAYGYIKPDGSSVLYVQNILVADPNKLVYAANAITPNIIKNYIMENKLVPMIDASSTLYGYKTDLADVNPSVLYVKSIPNIASPFSGTDIQTYRHEVINDYDKLAYNFTPGKNIYDNNWQINLSTDVDPLLNTVREYYHIGTVNDSLYLKYRVYSIEDSCTLAYNNVTHENDIPIIMYEYEMIERIKGLYKFKSDEGHKSNVFSITVENSGLADFLNNVDPPDEQTSNLAIQLKTLMTESIRKFTKKIIPAHTQLWKVEFTGK